MRGRAVIRSIHTLNIKLENLPDVLFVRMHRSCHYIVVLCAFDHVFVLEFVAESDEKKCINLNVVRENIV